MTKVQIILGSTRPNRNGKVVADWVYKVASGRKDMEVELVDVADFGLPLLDEPAPPSLDQYTKEHTKKWAEKIAEADAFVFVTGEYNHSIPGALKNAIDFLFKEWNNKAAGFVSYGSNANGQRAVEHLRQVMGELMIADVRATVGLSLAQDFENYSALKEPSDQHVQTLTRLLDQVSSWGSALKQVREAKS